MKQSRALYPGLIAALLLVGAAQVRAANGPQIWFMPRSGSDRAEDFYRLFVRAAPWQRAASRVKVFEIAVQLESDASDAQLLQILRGLRQRHIALALDMLALKGGGPDGIDPTVCGFGIEGYSSPLQSLAIAERFKKLGANVVYYDMDEPLFYGHFFDGKNACHSSMRELIADIAEKTKQVRTRFPAVQIGESEPVPAVIKLGLADLEEWLDAFQDATGRPLAFLRLDMDWDAQWQPKLIEVAHLLKRKGVALQVIYNGLDRDHSDRQWITHALAHAHEVEALVHPDAVAIETWVAYPRRVLPESDPASMTGLIDQYYASRHSAH